MNKLMLLILLSLSMLAFQSCSSGDTDEDSTEEIVDIQDDSSEDEFEDDLFSKKDPEETSEKEEISNLEKDTEAAFNEEMAEAKEEDLFVQESNQIANAPQEMKEEVKMVSSNNSVGMSALSGMYQVQKGETLMMIAFKIYGDVSKWRDIAEMNGIYSPSQMSSGAQLKYNVPSEPFEWRPEGNPYLIKRGDTLGTISQDVYGSNNKWREIYNNNRPLIKDPNRIFAGFTLYYKDGSYASLY